MAAVSNAACEGTAGPAESAEALLPSMYSELRKLAAARLASEEATATMQPTALVHEAWLRLTRTGQPAWSNRAHFFAAAAESMRRILIDHARRRHAQKRGGGARALELDAIDLAAETDDESLLAVDEALWRLASVDPQSAELIQLRFFAGLNYREAAQVLNISERAAKRLWTFGRSWLYRELSREAKA